MRRDSTNIITKAPNFSYLHFHIRATWVEATINFNTSIAAPIQYPNINIGMLI